ncbi:MAG: GAF domain-containing sensor histidine kinase [Fimbriimonadaceae bacterium]|nr:GAF domain-containing sensor histidine kinase [Fimbriimonadaceae bacterium]
MQRFRDLARLVSQVSRESDPDVTLRMLVDACREIIGGSHALMAVVNEEKADLEVVYGSGPDWESVALGKRLPLVIGQREGLVGWVAATGKEVVSHNVQEEPLYRALFPSTRSEIAVPVRDQLGRVRAVLNLESDRADAYGEVERELLQVGADLAALTMQRADVLRREQALMQIGSALDTMLTEEELIEQVIHVAEETLRLHSCSIFLTEPQTGRVILRGTIGHLRDRVGTLSYDKGEGFTGWVALHGRPILLDEPQADPRWRGKYVEIPSEQIASFLAVPIEFRNEILGVIRVLRRRSESPFIDNRFDDADMQILLAIAGQIAAGLENVRNIANIVRSERMIAWGELSAKSSHMIGNRIFAIKGDVNELGHLAGQAEIRAEDVAELQRSLSTNVQRVEEILNDFRDFVSATQIERSPTDLNAVIRETVDEVFPKRSPITLVLQLGELPMVSVDARRLRRAVSELIENGLNHMSEGQMTVSSWAVSGGGGVAVAISDTGPGVPHDQKERIFQPFFSGRVKGMGLGLSIVKGILEAHGGHVFEDGIPGDGARFVLLLPA